MTLFLSILFVVYALGVAYVIFGCMFTMIVPVAVIMLCPLRDKEEP